MTTTAEDKYGNDLNASRPEARPKLHRLGLKAALTGYQPYLNGTARVYISFYDENKPLDFAFVGAIKATVGREVAALLAARWQDAAYQFQEDDLEPGAVDAMRRLHGPHAYCPDILIALME